MRDEDWPLLVAWLLAAMRPTGPFPVLALYGEQGSAKSTTARLLRMLVDPNSAPLRCEPREPRDLMIAANNGWVVALDNLSRITPWLSDALCRLSTGGGFSTRSLYTDDDEVIFESQRPAIVTGIEELASRGDLLDRALIVYLPTISEDNRRPESQLWADFEQQRPQILGGLLDVVAAAIRNLPATKLDVLPRMADFALWATAAETALWAAGTFAAAYAANRDDANCNALDGSPVAKVLTDWLKDPFVGTASDLLAELDAAANEQTKRLKSWPKTPQAMGGALSRLAPNLRQAGIAVNYDRKKNSRLIRLRRDSVVTAVTSVTEGDKGDKGDNEIQTNSNDPPRDLFTENTADPEAVGWE